MGSMSKRSRNIASMFAAKPPEETPEAAAAAAATRVPAVSVRTMRDSFTSFERENDDLRDLIAGGAVVLDLDPGLIDPSPISDRFEDEDSTNFDLLCRSIAERGQEVPVLVRRHPLDPDRYQTAYGHRRIRAARALRRPVRAVVRVLSDEDLVISQGLENSAREDLTFIERAMFALRLERAGYERTIGSRALSVDKPELSKLLTVARTVPPEIVNAIGRAPKIGRLRWQSLTNAIARDDYIVGRLRRRAIDEDFLKMPSDDRFIEILKAATGHRSYNTAAERSILDRDGVPIASMIYRGRNMRLTLNPDLGESFAAYLEFRLPSLVESYRTSFGTDKPDGSSQPRTRKG
jgi:ParB family chromosome partitioning protein